MKVLRSINTKKSLNKKTGQLKNIWPKGYKRFDSKDNEGFEIRPQKYNLRLMLLSLLILLILWFFLIRPYLNQIPKKEGPIKVKLYKDKENIPTKGSSKPK